MVQALDASFLAALTGVRRAGLIVSQLFSAGGNTVGEADADGHRPVNDILAMHLPCSFHHLRQSSLEHRRANESAAQLLALGQLRPPSAELPLRVALRATNEAQQPSFLSALPCEACAAAVGREVAEAAEALAARLGAPPPAHLARQAQLASVLAEVLAAAANKAGA